MLRCILALLAAVQTLPGAVSRVEITERADLPVAGFERISGKLHFALDPALPANQRIVDLALAPRNAQGLVEFASDFLVLRPKTAAQSNGTALVEIVNRGRVLSWTALNVGANLAMRTARDFGDNFLLKQGYTLIWVGWQFDVPAGGGNLKVYAPVIANLTGPVRIEMLPNERQTAEVLPYPLAEAASGVMTVRDAPYGPRTLLPRSRWKYSEDRKRVLFNPALEPGRIYEFVYTAKDPVVAGVGMAAVRDAVSHFKRNGVTGSQAVPIQRALGFGISQSGRLLRTFLAEGFNADEQGRQVFEGVWAHVAGAGHGGFNQRFAQPGRTTGQFSGSYNPTDQPPFAPGALLESATEAGVAPKLFLTNGSHEYWGRAAALNHITEDGSRDLDPPANVRIYFVAGTQHSGAGGVANPQVQNITNNMDWTYFLRATLTNLNAWITHNTAPPASQFPRMDKGQLAPAAALTFPPIPNFAVVNYAYAPRRLDWGPNYLTKGIATWEPARAGGAYPAMVPQVDADGNETSGIRLPELVWPLRTYTGWNLRHPNLGAPDQQFPLIGSQADFARTKAQREQTGDTRLSVTERYSSRGEYLAKIESAARALATQRFLRSEDVPNVVGRAGRQWDAVMRPAAAKPAK
jgi:hypothetical protein